MANHFRLDLNLVELLAGVDADDGTNHLRDDNHVAEVRLDEVGFFVGLGLGLGLAQLLDQTHGLALETTVEPTTGTGMDEVAEFFGGEVEEPGVGLVCYPLGHSGSICVLPGSARDDILVKVDSTVRELAEGSLSLELCSLYCQPTFHL